ncbi:hypothetical protein PV327_006522 [Microctonus hyperodae]|uniref:Uncharacterized protein n=1 Tax=Microctonus hyperodae TaxID=165561 RepID=A0AA39KIK4_MICHY|nr:hypothetical protein PV327_006522 [Microctonus hyperodae]
MDAMYHSGSGRNTKWVCPNDRQLALRAKLKTGWSVKSSSLDSRYDDYNQYSSSYPGNLSSTSNSNKNVPLTDDERQRIIEVIQRAEALDQSEQERVGKLVERLDNMKRNVSMVTSTRSNGRNCGSRCIRGNKCICCCALCGEKFTVLGAGPTLCRDCRKYVCQKCGVETTTAAVAPISNAKNSQTDRQQRPISASIGNLSSLESLVNVNPPSTPPTKVFLCRICTETREMWKKSGAWFFKSLPKYILPEKKKPRSGSKCAAWTLTGSSRSLEPAELTQDSSSDEDITRGNGTHRRLFVSSSLSSEPGESASTQKRFETLVEVHNKRGSSLDLNNALIENEIKSVSLQLQPSTPNLLSPGQLIVPIISSTLTSPTSPLSPLSPSRSSNRLRDQRDKMTTGSGSSQSSTFLRQFAIGSSESVDRESTDSGTKKKQSCQSVSGNSSNDKINQIRGVGSTLESTDPTSSRYHATASRRQSDSTLQYQQRQQCQRNDGQQKNVRQQQSTRPRSKSTVDISTNGSECSRNGRREKLRNVGDSPALRAKSNITLSSMQIDKSKSSTSNGHSRSRGSVLRTQHITDRSREQYHNEIEKQNSSQDTRSRIQRAAQLLRDNRERYDERKGFAYNDPTGRRGWSGLSRRSQISLARTTAISNEILQRLADGTLSSGSRGECLGRRTEQRSRKDISIIELQHESTSTASSCSTSDESISNGQQWTI